MTACAIDSELIEKTIQFHGHWCPGLAIGIRIAEAALREIGRAEDEEIIAVTETDMCAVDAVQYLTGCTFGKGNLIYRDYGKNAFTFYRRGDGKAVRIVGRPSLFGEVGAGLGDLHKKMLEQGLNEEEEKSWRGTRARVSRQVMDSDLDDLFDIIEVKGDPPGKARILGSLICRQCGEPVMETRTRRLHDKVYCIPCFELKDR